MAHLYRTPPTAWRTTATSMRPRSTRSGWSQKEAA